LPAIKLGQPQIQKDEGVILGGQGSFRGAPVAHPVNRVAILLATFLEAPANHGVVFNKEHPHRLAKS
jgi:hypothetical protein